MSIYKKEFVMNFRKTNNQQMRSGKVVVRSMLSTQVACLLNCLAPQLAVMLNNMMVSQFLGVDCFKASSVFSPSHRDDIDTYQSLQSRPKPAGMNCLRKVGLQIRQQTAHFLGGILRCGQRHTCNLNLGVQT